MVVIVDLDDDVHNPYIDPSPVSGFADFSRPFVIQSDQPRKAVTGIQVDSDNADHSVRPNLNLNGFSAALSCYPVVSQLAKMLDLNSLHDLALTCRQFRANLLPFRKQLIALTLRCSNEDKPVNSLMAERFRESHTVFAEHHPASYGGALFSGKIGQCARDMVGECRRCGVIVCRNCTTKPPPTPTLSGRHRRLCQSCTKSPIAAHTAPRPSKPQPPTPLVSPVESPFFPAAREQTPRFPATEEELEAFTAEAFTAEAFTRSPCCCDGHLWLCQTCGYALRSMDSTYMRGWAWRTRYSTYLGGLGTGIGEGNEGVQCGRGSSCLSARIVEQELDLPAEEMRRLQEEMDKVEAEGTGRSWRGASWAIQECEGVGGGVRKKLRKLVKVGAVVKEFEDERDGRRGYLEREKQGERRSWCAWCERVIPGAKDRESGQSNDDRPSSSSSDRSSLILHSDTS